MNAAFFRLWVPKIRRPRARPAFPTSRSSARSLDDAVNLSPYVRDRGMPNVLDFPFQDAAAGYASGAPSAVAIANRLDDDDYFRLPDGATRRRRPSSGTTTWAAPPTRSLAGAGLTGRPLLKRALLGYDLMYFLRGAPAVYYGDEVGMIGSAATRRRARTCSRRRWRTGRRDPRRRPADRQRLLVRHLEQPGEARLKLLASIRDAYPELATGETIMRYAKGEVLVV